MQSNREELRQRDKRILELTLHTGDKTDISRKVEIYIHNWGRDRFIDDYIKRTGVQYPPMKIRS